MSQFHLRVPRRRPAGPEQLHGEWRMGDQESRAEALGVLRLLSLHPSTWTSLTATCHATPALYHRQRHHPLPALLLLNRPGVLPAHRLRVQLVAAAVIGGSHKAVILGSQE